MAFFSPAAMRWLSKVQKSTIVSTIFLFLSLVDASVEAISLLV
jgi:hypothetical protein